MVQGRRVREKIYEHPKHLKSVAGELFAVWIAVPVGV